MTFHDMTQSDNIVITLTMLQAYNSRCLPKLFKASIWLPGRSSEWQTGDHRLPFPIPELFRASDTASNLYRSLLHPCLKPWSPRASLQLKGLQGWVKQMLCLKMSFQVLNCLKQTRLHRRQLLHLDRPCSKLTVINRLSWQL